MPIIKNLTDLDLYKLSQCQMIIHQIPKQTLKSFNVQYRFFNRTQDHDILDVVDISEIENEVKNILSLKFTKSELKSLREIKYFTPDFIDFLSTVDGKNITYDIFEFNKIVNGKAVSRLEFTFSAPWMYSILYETLFLSAFSEMYCQKVASMMDKNLCKDIGMERLFNKLKGFDVREENYCFTDFGTRRRFSREWQEYIVNNFMKKYNPEYHYIGLTDTSNVKLALDNNKIPVGTIAHETFMVWKAFSKNFRDCQKDVLNAWYNEYKDYPHLLIALSDTYGTNAFFEDFFEPQESLNGKTFAHVYSGVRQDSGDPVKFAHQMIHLYNMAGINPKERIIIFSDGLDFDKMLKLYIEFKDQIQVKFGIGTNFTNDCGVKPLSLVIKAFCGWYNGSKDIVYFSKLSENPDKHTGDEDAVQEAIKAFNYREPIGGWTK